VANMPQMLVIAIGYYARVQVPEKTIKSLRTVGIEVRIAKTREAVAEFSRIKRDRARIVATRHLTYCTSRYFVLGFTFSGKKRPTPCNPSGSRFA
jgi:hypothetical protein